MALKKGATPNICTYFVLSYQITVHTNNLSVWILSGSLLKHIFITVLAMVEGWGVCRSTVRVPQAHRLPRFTISPFLQVCDEPQPLKGIKQAHDASEDTTPILRRWETGNGLIN